MRRPVQRAARRTQGLAVAVSIGLAIAAVLSISVIAAVRDRAAFFDGLTFEGILALDAAEFASLEAEAIAADDAVFEATAPYLTVSLVTGVLWILWQRRFVRNALPFGQITGSLGWGTWGWFVPLANLYFPESQLAQAARISDPDRLRKEGGSGASPFVYAWWAAWTGSTILSIGGSLAVPSPVELVEGTADLDGFQQADLVQSMGFGLAALAALLGIAAVLHTTHRQRTMLRALGVHA